MLRPSVSRTCKLPTQQKDTKLNILEFVSHAKCTKNGKRAASLASTIFNILRLKGVASESAWMLGVWSLTGRGLAVWQDVNFTKAIR